MPAVSGYTLSTTTEAAFPEAVERVRAELQAEGFGILCEIDVQATLRAKLGAETEPYLILGACNPPLAHRALGVDRSIGLLLPCNVVVRTTDKGTVVEIADPQMLVGVSGESDLEPVADEARRRLAAVLASFD
jgi:uncharacterized protein (DUF302 family)